MWKKNHQQGLRHIASTELKNLRKIHYLDVAFGALWPKGAVVEVVSGMILLHPPELMMRCVMMSVQMMT